MITVVSTATCISAMSDWANFGGGDKQKVYEQAATCRYACRVVGGSSGAI